MSVWHSHFDTQKQNVCGSCDHCIGYSGTRVRVFSSQAEFEKSEYYDGEDLLKDDPGGAVYAVWPGKHNVGRQAANYWLCLPVHPNCGCGWREISAADDTQDWFGEIADGEMEKYVTRQG